MAAKSQPLIKVVVVVGVLAAIAVLLFNYLRPTVVVAAARVGVAVSEIPGTVSVTAEGGIRDITAVVAGKVATSHLAKNAKVREGEELVTLDTQEVDLQINELETRIATAVANQAFKLPEEFSKEAAEVALKTAQLTAGTGGVTQAYIDARKGEVDGLDNKVKAVRLEQTLNIDLLKNDLAKKNLLKKQMTIPAPFDGEIYEVLVKPNENVGPGTVLARITSNARIVEARITQDKYSQIKVGQEATVKLDTFGDTKFTATVTQIASAADPNTQRYAVTLELKDIPPEKLIAGLNGEARIVVGQKPGAVLIPVVALNGQRVFVVKDGRVEVRSVQTGSSSAVDREIISGVVAGEDVIVDRFGTVRDGDRVKIERVK